MQQRGQRFLAMMEEDAGTSSYARFVDAFHFTANVDRVIKQTPTAPNLRGKVQPICAFSAGIYFGGN
eukprot:2065404-Prorocentrum_lima.AAC.1